MMSSLRGGGAERVLTTLANEWAARNSQVTVVTVDGEPPAFALSDRVLLRQLGLAGDSRHRIESARNSIRRASVLRAEVARSGPDCVVSFIDVTNILVLAATRGLGLPVVVSERTDPGSAGLRTEYRILRGLLYRFADAIVVQSEEVRDFFSKGIQPRCHVIPNPVSASSLLPFGETVPGTKPRKVVSMGRLSKEKGFDLLIEAFGDGTADHRDWTLEIWGEGPERPKLETLIGQEGLQGRVRLPGWTSTPESVFADSSIFALSSVYEGFPNALCEAMAAGLPAVATDCPSGPRQVIRSGENGILVAPGSRTALADGIRMLIEDPDLRKRLASRAPEVVKRFSVNRIMDLWENVLTTAIGRRRGRGV